MYNKIPKYVSWRASTLMETYLHDTSVLCSMVYAGLESSCHLQKEVYFSR